MAKQLYGVLQQRIIYRGLLSSDNKRNYFTCHMSSHLSFLEFLRIYGLLSILLPGHKYKLLIGKIR